MTLTSVTVVVADDERPARKFLTGLLKACPGTQLVGEAASGEEALAKARAHTGAIPLLVTDLVMPGMGGRALAEYFLTLHPEGRVLYVSGYAGDAMVRRGLSVPEAQFLQKPFNADALVRKVAEVLSSDVTPASILPALEKTFGSWKAEGMAPLVAAVSNDTSAGISAR